MDENEIMNEFFKILKRELPDWDLKLDKSNRRIYHNKGNYGGCLCLTEFLTQAKNKRDSIENLAKARIEALRVQEQFDKYFSWDYVKDHLMLRLKTKSFLNQGMNNSLWHRQYVGVFNYVFAIDTPLNIMYATTEIVDMWKKPTKELEKIALANTKKYPLNLKYDTIKTRSKNKFAIFCGDDGDIVFMRRKFLRKIIDKNFPELKGKTATIFFPFRNIIMLAHYEPNEMMDLHISVNNMIADNVYSYAHTSKPFMIDKDGIIEEFRHDDFKGFPDTSLFMPITFTKDKKINIGEGFFFKDKK
jgi:hypothetical protein